MSSTVYYNFITADKRRTSAGVDQIEAHRQTAASPSSFVTTSSSTSNSSLNQLGSLTHNSTIMMPCAGAGVVSSSSASSSASSTSSSASNSFATNGTRRMMHRQMSITPTQTMHHHHSSQLFHSYTLHSLEPKPLKPFKTSSDYLEAMKEDLSEWLNRLYNDLNLTCDNFFNQLETGAIICRHANNVTQMGRNFMISREQCISSSDSGLNETVASKANDNINCNKGTTINSPVSPTSSEFSLYGSIKQNLSLTSTSSTRSFNNNNNNSTINWFNIKTIPFKRDAKAGTFFARDNICQFILWCRSLNILDCLLFETDDLVVRKNEKSFILCLLEVARIGFKVGMPTPLIIQLEQEIDREIENEAKLQEQLEKDEKRNRDNITDSYEEDDNDDGVCEVDYEQENSSLNEQIEKRESVTDQVEEKDEEDTGPKPQVITNDLLSLHEKVVQLLCQCTCPTQFPMVRVGDNGKYKVGDKLIIFVRILRRHIMVRVGGGWQELSEFLRVKDPCRSKSFHGNHIHNQQLSHNTQLQARIAPNSYNSNIAVSKSRLVESSQQLYKGHHQFRNGSGGQRLISGSASMSWLSHNS